MVSSSLHLELFDCIFWGLGFALAGSLARFGSMVLAVHDASDVFLEVGKLTKYSGLVVIPSVSFIMFAISWFVLRLVIFPFVLIRSSRYVLFRLLMAATRSRFLMFGCVLFLQSWVSTVFQEAVDGRDDILRCFQHSAAHLASHACVLGRFNLAYGNEANTRPWSSIWWRPLW